MRKKEKKPTVERARRRLRGILRIKSFRLELIITIFCLMLLASGVTLVVYSILHALLPALKNFDAVASSASILIACTIIGTGAAAVLSKWILAPLKEMIDATERIAKGDFEVHIQENFSETSDFGRLQRSFNHMAAELGGIEMFRNDFINNFSHEFKTPIVSITGLANLLELGNLTEEQRIQYARAIREESMRLSSMASNVLNLTKVENQTILTGVSRFNLSEQVRSAVLLLEEKWTSKNIDLQLDLDEYLIEANEEMLKQVWINLIDNAVKFVPRCGTVELDILDAGDHLCVQVSNTGSDIPPEKQEKIFAKFYQADESHATQGNGIGLAIVKSVVALHNGEVGVKSGDGITTFTVTLPKKQ